MDTDQTTNEENRTYDPVIEEDLNENSISEEIMGGLLDLVFTDKSIRNVGVFSFGLLMKFGINFSDIQKYLQQLVCNRLGQVGII